LAPNLFTMKTTLFLLFFAFLLQNCFAQIVFNVCDVKRNVKDLKPAPYEKGIQEVFGDVYAFGERETNANLVGIKSGHAFVAAVSAAYSGHHGLVISPDMVWLMICQGFSNHVRANSDSLRHKIVAFEGKKKISLSKEVVEATKKWQEHFPIFCDSLQLYIGDSLTRLMCPKFSTTGLTETAAFQITLMESMNSYFEYEERVFCGIPQITLTGKPSDWKWILDHINDFDKYELGWWTAELKPILKQFYNASRGKIDTPFWQSIYSIKDICGWPMSGWCIKFFPYLVNASENKWRKNPYIEQPVVGDWGGIGYDAFPKGCAKADVKIVVGFPNEIPTEIEFIAGFVGYSENENKDIVPEINWVVRKK
jgi:Domain of unknown function (DUF4419)